MKKLRSSMVVIWMTITLTGCGLLTSEPKDVQPDIEMNGKFDELDPDKG